MGADFDAQLEQARLIAIEDGFGQAEIGNAVLQHAADFVLFLKDGHKGRHSKDTLTTLQGHSKDTLRTPGISGKMYHVEVD